MVKLDNFIVSKQLTILILLTNFFFNTLSKYSVSRKSLLIVTVFLSILSKLHYSQCVK